MAVTKVEKHLVNVGDTYEVPDDERNNCGSFETYGTVAVYVRITECADGSSFRSYDILNKKYEKINSCSGCFSHRFEFFPFAKKSNNSKSKSFMASIAEKFALITKGEPEKSFIKACITGMDGLLTSEGEAVFLAWLLKKNGEAFKTEVVDPILADVEKK